MADMACSVALGAYVPADWEAAGEGVTAAVATVLRSLGYENVYMAPPSARLCCEPIMVACGTWERESRQADGAERGLRTVDVLVCCEDPSDAEATCRAVERDLRRDGWTGSGDGWHCRVAAIDSGAPEYRGRDSSGRWLWGFALALTVVRDLEGDSDE